MLVPWVQFDVDFKVDPVSIAGIQLKQAQAMHVVDLNTLFEIWSRRQLQDPSTTFVITAAPAKHMEAPRPKRHIKHRVRPTTTKRAYQYDSAVDSNEEDMTEALK